MNIHEEHTRHGGHEYSWAHKTRGHSPMAHSYPRVLMQPSMGTLNSPSLRVVKDSTPSRRRILRYINFGIGESSRILFFGHDESSPDNIWSMVNLERMFVLLFYYFLYFKVNLDLEKTNQLGESSPNFIFAVVNLDPIILEMTWIDVDGESWPNDFVEKVNRGEDLRWVGSRCLLTRVSIVPKSPGALPYSKVGLRYERLKAPLKLGLCCFTVTWRHQIF